jgi:TfoX/Sxy family transcriptional regulator of competence genes
MSYNEGLTERVRDLLAHIPHVEEKKMFGSIGFIVNGKLCMSVGNHDDHVMMVRIGPEKYEEALVKSPANLREWVNLALDYNQSLR